jgi:hypothetical protein
MASISALFSGQHIEPCDTEVVTGDRHVVLLSKVHIALDGQIKTLNVHASVHVCDSLDKFMHALFEFEAFRHPNPNPFDCSHFFLRCIDAWN